MNQCDGCQRGLPIEGGIHRGEGYDLIGCTADRYESKFVAIFQGYNESDYTTTLVEVANAQAAILEAREAFGRQLREVRDEKGNVIYPLVAYLPPQR